MFAGINVRLARLREIALVAYLRLLAILDRRTLVIVDGVPGSGKTRLSDFIAEHYDPSDATILPKFKTTARAGELSVDTIAISENEFSVHAKNPDFFCYRFGLGGYGFFGRDLDRVLLRSRVVVVTVRSSAVMERLRTAYPFLRVVSVFVHADEHLIRQRLTNKSADVVERRLSRTVEIWPDYHALDYDITILNHRTADEFDATIEELLSRFGATRQVALVQPAVQIQAEGFEETPAWSRTDQQYEERDNYEANRNSFDANP